MSQNDIMLRLNDRFLNKILLLGTILFTLLILILIFTLQDLNIFMWFFIIPIFIIYFGGSLIFLEEDLILKKKNLFQTIKKDKEFKSQKRNHIKITSLMETVFWISTLLLSFFFVFYHGFFNVDHDLYFGKADLFYNILFKGDYQPFQDSWQNIFKLIFYRSLYSILILFVSLPLSFFCSLEIAFNISGVLINIVAGFITLIYSGKTLEMISENKTSKRVGRLITGTFSTFIVYWTKFSSDLIFLSFFTIALYYLLKFKKQRKYKNLILFMLSTILAILVREVGIFLIFIGLNFYFDKRNGLTRYIKISGFIFILIISFIVFADKLLTTRHRYWYFYNYVFPINSNNPEFNLEN
jgi:hypothetical protein